MADEKKPKGRKKPVEPEVEGSALVAAEKAKGTAPGKIASPAEVAQPAPVPSQTKPSKQTKLQKKNKSRLPSRQKKALRKGAATPAKV